MKDYSCFCGPPGWNVSLFRQYPFIILGFHSSWLNSYNWVVLDRNISILNKFLSFIKQSWRWLMFSNQRKKTNIPFGTISPVCYWSKFFFCYMFWIQPYPEYYWKISRFYFKLFTEFLSWWNILYTYEKHELDSYFYYLWIWRLL